MEVVLENERNKKKKVNQWNNDSNSLRNDPLGINAWDAQKIKLAAEKLVRSGLLDENDWENQKLKKFLKQELDKLAHNIPDRVEKIKKKLIEFTKHKPPLIIEEIGHGLSDIKTDNSGKQIIEDMQQSHHINETKRINILGYSKMLHEVRTSKTSTKQRLSDRFDLNLAKMVINELRTTTGDHFLLNNDPEKMEFYYGSDEGQRLCVQAAMYIRDLQQDVRKINDTKVEALARGLLEAVKKDMGAQEKESWKCVVNYWLAGDVIKGLGLSGERAQGLSNQAQWLPGNQQQALDKFIEGNVINFSSFKHSKDDERRLFIQNFRTAQLMLGKNWIEDVKRDDYQHKPSRKRSNNQISNNQIYEDLINRRMCKWTLHVAHFNQQSVVYALDKLELGPIARGDILDIKDCVSGDGIKRKVPICTSELREVFRNVDKFEKNISYYERLMKVPAPWEKGKDHLPELLKSWAEYAMHLTRRLLLEHPGDQRCFDCAKEILYKWQEKKWDEVIEAYKKINPSELHQIIFPLSKQYQDIHHKRIQQAKERCELMDQEKAYVIKDVANQLTACIKVSLCI